MPSTPFKGFALVDCNNFYVSCERVFKPHLEKTPALVLSNNDGCIIARSKEVKDLKIPMGAPFFEYKSLIKAHNIHIFSPNFELYSDMSDRVMQILYEFCEEIELYSIDEAFIPITIQSEKDFLNLSEKIKKWTGIPVSIGLAPTKTLAKLANYTAKQREVLLFSLMNTSDHDDILKETPVKEIWGVGRKTSEKLHTYHIYNAYQLKNASKEWMRKKFHLNGLRTLLELSATPCYYPEIEDEFQKSLTYSSSFGTPIESFELLKESVVHYTSKAAQKLRAKSLLTPMISLYLKTNNGSFQQSLSLNFATNTTPILIEAALNLLKKMYLKVIYKKAGIYFWDLVNEKHQQFDFRSEENFKETKLMQTVDQINKKYGSQTLFYASEGFTKPWISKRERLSNEYSTKLSHVLNIKI